jgi:murein DD-endopeptidase MepM/ murein hydrolase activator NlpD
VDHVAALRSPTACTSVVVVKVISFDLPLLSFVAPVVVAIGVLIAAARPLAPDAPPPPPPAEVVAPGECHAELRDLLAHEPVTLAVHHLSERVVPGGVAGFEVEVTSDHGPAGELMARLGDQVAHVARVDDGTRWYVIAPVPLYERERDLTLWIEGALYDGRLFAEVENVPVERIRRGKNRTRHARWYRKLKRKQRSKGPEERRLQDALASSSDSRLWRGSFELPMRTRVTSAFGAWRRIGRRWSGPHLGTDMHGRVGWKVRAIGDGRVVMLGRHKFAGRTIVVDHGGGLLSQYLHMSRRHVRRGDFVKKGEVIGRVGRTGRVTGPHLHLQVSLGGVFVDAESLTALDLSGDERPERSELFSALAPEADPSPEL